jgi:hypothetical protein
MTQGLKILLLILSTSVLYGQTKKTRIISTCFLEFDKIVTRDSIGAEIRTDKIYFSKDNKLDTIKSKMTLDSVVWFFKKHSGVACELTLKKGHEILGNEYRNTKLGRQQTNQIVSYLKTRMELPGVILTDFIVCGSPWVTNEEFKKIKDGTTNKDKTLRLSLFIYDKRQYDPNTSH